MSHGETHLLTLIKPTAFDKNKSNAFTNYKSIGLCLSTALLVILKVKGGVVL